MPKDATAVLNLGNGALSRDRRRGWEGRKLRWEMSVWPSNGLQLAYDGRFGRAAASLDCSSRDCYWCTEFHVPCLLLYGLFLFPDFSKDLKASYQERVCMMLYCFAGAADISNSREIWTLSLPG